MKKIIKRGLLWLSLILLILITINSVSAVIVHNTMFNRWERPDYNITPGLVEYEDIKNDFPRNIYTFNSKSETLSGYYYPNDNAKAMIVMVHGFKSGADSLLSPITYFLDNEYCVFSYDGTGCYDSSGKIGGFSQSLIDLENALYFLNNNNEFKDYKKLLFGYSLGGYSTTAIFNLTNENLYGSVSIAGYNNTKNIFVNKAKKYVGPLAYLGKPFMDLITYSRFKKYSNYTAVDGINNTDIPIFLIHSQDDEVVIFENESIISQKSIITNKNVTFYALENKSHTGILYSQEAINYQNQVNTTIERLQNYQNKKTFNDTVDDRLYSQLNSFLFEQIILFYDNCIEKTQTLH